MRSYQLIIILRKRTVSWHEQKISNIYLLHFSAYGEVVATLERLQLQLQNISGALGVSGPGVETELKAVRALLVQNQFASALATRHALKNRLRASKILKHHADDASNLARDVCKIYTVMIYIHIHKN